MSRFFQDLRYAFRMMRQNPGFTVAAILALALGIGATTAIFSVVNGVILRPLPYPDADRLVQIFETEPSLPTVPVNMADYLDWKKQAHSFQSLAMYIHTVANLTGTGEPSRVWLMSAESTLLPLLGTEPIIGRNFTAEENQPGHDHEAILSYGFWKARFGGDRGALGQKLMLDGDPFTIIGVLPPDLRFLRADLDIWVPLTFDLTKGGNQRGNHGRFVLGRLTAGASIASANAELKSMTSALEKQYPQQNTGVSAIGFILKDRMLAQIRPALWVLLAAVGCVLLIACTNVANLLLARATSRQKEVAVRIAVGAGRGQLIRQLLTESFLMALIAGLLGLLVAFWSVDLVRSVKNSRIPRIGEVTVDSNVLLFAAGIALVTAILFGLAPALRISNTSLTGAMSQTSGRTTETGSQRKVRMWLVGGEVCLATVLLVGSGLLIRSFMLVSGIDPGFRPDGVLTMNMNFASARYQKPEVRAQFFERVLAEVRSLPGVQSAALTTKLPLLGGSNGGIMVEGQPKPTSSFDTPMVEFSLVTTGYFTTMGIRLLRGRDFDERDRRGATDVVVVNEKLVSTFWKGQDPIGKRIAYLGSTPAWKVVVGVVRDVRQWGLEYKAIPEMYIPVPQDNPGFVTLVARTGGDPLALSNSVKERIRTLDAEQPVFDVDTMEHITSNQLGFRTFNTSLLLVFAAIAMTLASIGIYGVISYSVAQRVPELGIRIALGAARRDVVNMVLRQGMTPAILGAVAGILLSLPASSLLGTLLYDVAPTDWVTLLNVAFGLIAIAALASYVPARRAASIDPIRALRYE